MSWVDILILAPSALLICLGLTIIIGGSIESACAWIDRE